MDVDTECNESASNVPTWIECDVQDSVVLNSAKEETSVALNNLNHQIGTYLTEIPAQKKYIMSPEQLEWQRRLRREKALRRGYYNAPPTPEQRERINALQRLRRQRTTLTPAQRERKNELQRIRRQNATDEQREREYIQQKKNKRNFKLTPEQRERKNALQRLKRKNAVLTPEQRDHKIIRERFRWQNATAEQRENYNARHRISHLTAEQRERRNARQRSYKKARNKNNPVQPEGENLKIQLKLEETA